MGKEKTEKKHRSWVEKGRYYKIPSMSSDRGRWKKGKGKDGKKDGVKWEKKGGK